MTPIYLHSYTFTPMNPINRNANGIQQIMVTIVSESKEPQGGEFIGINMVNDFFEQNLNIEHKILLEGYRNE